MYLYDASWKKTQQGNGLFVQNASRDSTICTVLTKMHIVFHRNPHSLRQILLYETISKLTSLLHLLYRSRHKFKYYTVGSSVALARSCLSWGNEEQANKWDSCAFHISMQQLMFIPAPWRQRLEPASCQERQWLLLKGNKLTQVKEALTENFYLVFISLLDICWPSSYAIEPKFLKSEKGDYSRH